MNEHVQQNRNNNNNGGGLKYYINADGTITFSKQEYLDFRREYDNTKACCEEYRDGWCCP